MSKGQQFPQYLTSLVSCMGGVMAGLALGWTSPVQDEIESGKLGFKVTHSEFGWIGAVLPLGAAISCIPAGFLINVIGRKVTLCILPIVYLIGWIFIQSANDTWMLYVGRIFLGIACGAACAATPVYIGETAQKEIRGFCGSFFQLSMVVGVLLVYIIGAFMPVGPVNYICMAICVLQFVSMILMPESPSYLIEKEKDDQATKALEFLRGKNYDTKSELELIKTDILERQKVKAEKPFVAKFNNIGCFRALYITFGLMFFQQFSGIKPVIFYSTKMIEEAGGRLEPRFSAIIVGAIFPIATLVAGSIVDRWGRRLLLILSAAFMAVSTTVFGFYFYFQEMNEASMKNLGWIPIIALCTYAIMYSIGYGPVSWIMIGELFAADVRGPAGAAAGASNWIFAFIVSKSYVSIKNEIGLGVTFWLFSILSLLGLFFVFFFVPETKGKSLQEIQEILSKKKDQSG